jgi:YVTN family beta-propeller protein
MLLPSPRRPSRRSFLGLCLAASSSCRPRRAPALEAYAFIANQESRTIAVLDLSTFHVIRQIALDSPPTALLSHPSQRLFYAIASQSGHLFEIDSETLMVRRQARTYGDLVAVQMARSRQELWLLSRQHRRLVRLSLNELRPRAVWPLEAEPTGFATAPWFPFSALAYGEAGEVQLFDERTGTFGPRSRIGQQLGACTFRSDGKALLAADRGANRLAVLEAPTLRPIAYLPLSLRPDFLCFNRDQGQLFITGEGRDAVAVVYPHYIPAIAETTLAGRYPGPMAASENYLFIANPKTSDVTILDIDTRRVAAVATVGAEPWHIAITPGDEYALVLNRASGDVAVIRIHQRMSNRRKTAALFTMVRVGARPVAALIQPTV